MSGARLEKIGNACLKTPEYIAIIVNYSDDTRGDAPRYQFLVECEARRVGLGSGYRRREIKSEERDIRDGRVSTRPKWWRSGRGGRKRRRSSHDTQCATMEPISVGKAAFVTACTLHARKQTPCLCVTNLIARRGTTRGRTGRGGPCTFASCVFIARPGNNNRLLFITPGTERTNRECSHLRLAAIRRGAAATRSNGHTQ